MLGFLKFNFFSFFKILFLLEGPHLAMLRAYSLAPQSRLTPRDA